jgi:hypothetical protein
MFAANALTGKDEYSVKYLKYTRANIAPARLPRPSRSQAETTEVYAMKELCRASGSSARCAASRSTGFPRSTA